MHYIEIARFLTKRGVFPLAKLEWLSWHELLCNETRLGKFQGDLDVRICILTLSPHCGQVSGHVTSKFTLHIKVNGLLLQLKFGILSQKSFCFMTA